MLFFRKLLRLPDPKDLGMSNSNCLPSREFTPDCDGPTWEDWDIKVKAKFPIKYFFAETLIDFVRFKLWLPIYRPLDEAHYWLVSHTIRRYHILDLRQPKNEYGVDEYRYGWRDVPEAMLYAIFNLLDQFVKHELPNFYCPPEEDIENKIQRDTYFEILAIHKWWFEDRKREYQEFSNCRTEWHKLHKVGDPHTDEIWNEMNKMHENFENKTDEMIARLMKVRRSLWI